MTLLGAQSIVFKVFKPIAEVLPEEVSSALRDALAGPTLQHLNAAPSAAAPSAAAPLAFDMDLAMECS